MKRGEYLELRKIDVTGTRVVIVDTFYSPGDTMYRLSEPVCYFDGLLLLEHYKGERNAVEQLQQARGDS